MNEVAALAATRERPPFALFVTDDRMLFQAASAVDGRVHLDEIR